MSRPKNLPKQILYNPHTRLGNKLPLVLTFQSNNKKIGILYWHTCEAELYKLEGGRGWIYGRQEWGPWFALRVYRYRVIGYKVPSSSEEEKIKELEEYLKDEDETELFPKRL